VDNTESAVSKFKLIIAEKQQSYAIKTITEALGSKSCAVLLLLCSLPFAFPIVIPGLSTPFGILLLFVSYCYMRKKRLWVPKYIANKHISHKHLVKIVSILEKFLHKTRHILRFRWPIFFKTTWITGLFLMIQSVFMAIPFPLPFTNIFAAVPIVLLALGLLVSDGLFIVLGYIASLLAIAFFTALFWFGI
jgi:hypothetical protein